MGGWRACTCHRGVLLGVCVSVSAWVCTRWVSEGLSGLLLVVEGLAACGGGAGGFFFLRLTPSSCTHCSEIASGPKAHEYFTMIIL